MKHFFPAILLAVVMGLFFVGLFWFGRPHTPPLSPVSCPTPPSPIVVFGDALRTADAVCGPVPFSIDVWPDGRVHLDCGRPPPIPKFKTPSATTKLAEVAP